MPAGLYDFIFGFLPFRETFPPALNWPTNNNNNNKYYHKKTRKQKHKPPYPIIPSPSVPLRCVAPFVECVSASPISHFRFRRTTRGGDLKAMGENASERTRAPTVVCRIFGPNPMEDGFGGIFSNRCDCVENTLRNFRTPLYCQKNKTKKNGGGILQTNEWNFHHANGRAWGWCVKPGFRSVFLCVFVVFTVVTTAKPLTHGCMSVDYMPGRATLSYWVKV